MADWDETSENSINEKLLTKGRGFSKKAKASNTVNEDSLSCSTKPEKVDRTDSKGISDLSNFHDNQLDNSNESFLSEKAEASSSQLEKTDKQSKPNHESHFIREESLEAWGIDSEECLPTYNESETSGYPNRSNSFTFKSNTSNQKTDNRYSGHQQKIDRKSSINKNFSRSKSPNNRNCYKCGEFGHMAKNCSSVDSNTMENFTNTKISKNSFNSNPSHKNKVNNFHKKHVEKEVFDMDSRQKAANYIPPELSEDDTLYDTISAGINFDKYDTLPTNLAGNSKIKQITYFNEVITHERLLSVINKLGFTKPTAIQKSSIPFVIAKKDLMGCAETGSGKTLAYVLPILQCLFNSHDLENQYNKKTQKPYALILAPTRELALQINKEFFKFCVNSHITCRVAYGGINVNHSITMLRKGTHILVSTPGRLEDFLQRGIVSFENIRFVVLDEADRMIDHGFILAVRNILSHETMPNIGERTTLMFSATFPNSIQQLASEFLSPDYLFLSIGRMGAANSDVKQTILKLNKSEKRAKLVKILKEFNERTIVFVETRKIADFLASFLCQNNCMTTSIHGDRFQSQREEALCDFRSGKCSVLVATNVAARGLDIKDVSQVINYDLPKEIDDYVHRIGRTGRVGHAGVSISFYDPVNDKPLAKKLIEVLQGSNQPVPDWLEEEVTESTHISNYESFSQFSGNNEEKNDSRNDDSLFDIWN